MEIIKTIPTAQIPKSAYSNEAKLKFLKSVATLAEGEALQLKLKHESEATRIANWLKDFKNNHYKLTRRTINKELFGFVYKEQK